MPRTGEMLPSKYLKKDDIGPGALVTLKSVSKENLGKEDDPEWKWAAHFQEFSKPLVLNKTNIKRLEKIFGSDNTDDWVGKQCVIYFDPDVEFAGEQVGGLRVRAPKNQQPVEDLPF